MSGGAFNYKQYSMHAIADVIAAWARVSDEYSPEVRAKMMEAVTALKRAFVYAQRVDYLLSGDDGEESFLQRLASDLSQLERE